MPRRLTALGAAGVAALGLAACGGSSEDDYKEDFAPLSQRVVGLGEDVSRAIGGAGESTDEALAGDFGDFAGRLDQVRQDVDDLESPEEVADEHDELVESMEEVQGSLEDVSEAAEEGDPEAARQATTDLIQRSTDLRRARGTLAAAVDDL